MTLQGSMFFSQMILTQSRLATNTAGGFGVKQSVNMYEDECAS